MAWMREPRQTDYSRHEESRREKEQRVRHVKLPGMVMRGAVVLRTALDAMWWVKERRSEHEDWRPDHQEAEPDPSTWA